MMKWRVVLPLTKVKEKRTKKINDDDEERNEWLGNEKSILIHIYKYEYRNTPFILSISFFFYNI